MGSSTAAGIRSTPGLGADLVHRGGRPDNRRLPVNDPSHPGLYGDIKAELSHYAREEMRLSGGLRVYDPAEEQDLEPWMKRRRLTGRRTD